jgi:hypothetical protein
MSVQADDVRITYSIGHLQANLSEYESMNGLETLLTVLNAGDRVVQAVALTDTFLDRQVLIVLKLVVHDAPIRAVPVAGSITPRRVATARHIHIAAVVRPPLGEPG